MNTSFLDDTIAAIATPVGNGGIGIIRISGSKAICIADRLFCGKTQKKLCDKKSHTISYGAIVSKNTGAVIDEALVSVMKAPHTYTKEDVVEINCHGGINVVQRVLKEVISNGARLAEPGEFTKRAFLNGRIDLTQAEAVIDMIQSKTELSMEAAASQLSGNLKLKIQSLRQKVMDMIAQIEAAIDYPEHDIEEETYNTMEKGVTILMDEITELIASAQRGMRLKDGIQTVILGRPNVGKSSLLNWFLQEERAIVTEIPGTTRDTVEETINISGITIRLVDTAGIRPTEDTVEKIGVEKSRIYAHKGDLILFMLDCSNALSKEDGALLKEFGHKNMIVILNKTDLKQKITQQELKQYVPCKNIIGVSVKQNEGVQNIVKRIKELFFKGDVEGISKETMIQNIRQKNALENALEALKRAKNTIEIKMPEDFISMDLQEVNNYLGEITGDSVDGEIIDRIFTRFCLGK